MSRPTWARGLKRLTVRFSVTVTAVAPHVGAWIETKQPLVLTQSMMSRPTWARGLKLSNTRREVLLSESRPTWARGLKRTCGRDHHAHL